MSKLDGIFSLRTPLDLLCKLEHDFKRLNEADPSTPEAQYAAFDFFVTAEHLPDWCCPLCPGATRTSLRNYPEGAIVSHVASGAKHFSVTRSQHKSVVDTRVLGTFNPNLFDPNVFDCSLKLIITLEDGSIVNVVDIATKVLEHWRNVVLKL